MRRTILLLSLAACGGALPRPISTAIPRLRATAGDNLQDKGVVVAVEAVTSYNWKKFPDIIAHLAYSVRDDSQAHGMGGSAPAAMQTRYDDSPMIPLPAFRVHIANHSGHALKLDGAHVRLEDDTQGVDARTVEELRAYIDTFLHEKENMRGRTLYQEQLQLVRGAVSDLPLYRADRVIPDGGDWIGYVSFIFNSEQTIEHVALKIDGTKLDSEPGPSFKFPFVVERKHAARVCKDNAMASPLGECPGDEQELSPAADGPCMQLTRQPQTQMRMQWWVGPNAVADSDLMRTLTEHPSSAPVIRRGLMYRALGYALVMSGIALSAAAAVVIGREVGPQMGPAGLSFLGISFAGGVVAWRGSKRTEDAVRVYNEQADAGGACAVIW